LEPGAHGFLDRGERSLTGLLVGIRERLANPADSGAGQGNLGYPVLADHDLIGVGLDGDGTEPGCVKHGADPAGIGEGKRAGLFGAGHRRHSDAANAAHIRAYADGSVKLPV